ncbi:MAG: hypothetical protein Q8R84_09810 [Candidatus Nitrotoga sp.]|nr:hypothetical protein [Candidatus Nitrotoga sp.]
MNKITLVSLVFSLLTVSAVQAAPEIYDPATGKYLGNLNSNQYDANSVSNPYGQYGSKYSPDSINNPYGQYGSKYSPDSPSNPYGSNPPVIINAR